MKTTWALVKRNRKLFFRDKGMLLASFITPIILIVLYGTFLANVYRDSFQSALPEFFKISDKLLNGTVASQLAVGLLAVSCVTVTFSVNLTMVQDHVNGARKDFNVSPVKKSLIYVGYFFATVLNSLMVNLMALVLCLGYVGIKGWYLSVADILWLILDEILLVLFGSIFSSIVCYPLKTQGQISAVQAIVSAGYGFICGAYMPISNFGSGLQKVLSFLPSTYGTSLLKNHMLRGVFEEMEKEGIPAQAISGIRDSLDCNPVFQGKVVGTGWMLAIMAGTIVILGIIYLLITGLKKE